MHILWDCPKSKVNSRDSESERREKENKLKEENAKKEALYGVSYMVHHLAKKQLH